MMNDNWDKLDAFAGTMLSHVADTTAHITASERTAWNAKQNALTFDSAPTAGSSNPVTSAGINTAVGGRAPTSHASTATTYGKGSSSNYGHVKLSDSTTSTSGVNDGVAATPAAIKALKDSIPEGAAPSSTTPKMDGTAATGTDTGFSRGDHVHPTDTSRAPTSHASTATTYGTGSDSNYGHVKLSSATDGTSGTSGGTAATPAAVKAVKDAIPAGSNEDPAMDGTAAAGTGTTFSRSDHVHPSDTSRAPTSHASTGTTYGKGTDANYGHVKLSDSTTSTTAAASGGTAATPAAVKAVKDAIPAATSTTPAMDGTAAIGSESTWARGDHVHPTDTSRAPTSHASTATTYGAGTDANYGHVKLSDSTTSTSGTSGGTAATPAAVKAVKDSLADYLPLSGGHITGRVFTDGGISMPTGCTSYGTMSVNLNEYTLAAGENHSVLTVYFKNTDGTQSHTVHPVAVVGTDNTSNGYNSGVRLGSTNGTTIVAAGECATTFASKNAKYDDENLYLVADGQVLIYKAANDGTISLGPLVAAGFGATPASGQLVVTSGTAGDIRSSGAALNTSGGVPRYQYSTTDLTAGTSALTTGQLYFVYE